MNATFTGDVIFSDNKYSETTIAGPQKKHFPELHYNIHNKRMAHLQFFVLTYIKPSDAGCTISDPVRKKILGIPWTCE